MKDSKQQFRIGELAKKLNIERFVIRFWEKEFGLKASRSEGGQRYYAQKDFERFQHIKILLYEKGLTIAGAKKALESKSQNKLSSTLVHQKENLSLSFDIHTQLTQLRAQLLALKKLL